MAHNGIEGFLSTSKYAEVMKTASFGIANTLHHSTAGSTV